MSGQQGLQLMIFVVSFAFVFVGGLSIAARDWWMLAVAISGLLILGLAQVYLTRRRRRSRR